MEDRRRESLMKEYGEVAADFRLLTDIRFKLLAFLPLAAGAAAAALPAADGAGSSNVWVRTLALSAFGLAATLGIVTYNLRNDQHYDALVGRAATIERNLGLADGAFANRPGTWLGVNVLGVKWPIGHRNSVALIYGATIALWFFGVLTALGRLVWAAGADLDANAQAPAWIGLLALGLAVGTTLAAAHAFRRQRERRQVEIRRRARDAVAIAAANGIECAIRDTDFVTACAAVAGVSAGTIAARARFVAALDECGLRYYVPEGSTVFQAAQLVAYLADVAPEWVLDCSTQRRVAISTDRSRAR